MKLIKISTELELSIHEFPSGLTEKSQFLQNLIGNHCDIYQQVMPRRLYTELHMKANTSKVPGQSVCMLVDEEGLLKENKPNLVGSYLYETDRHGNPIMGNILFVGKGWFDDGIDFCGIEDSVFKELKLQLKNMIDEMKAIKEAQGG